MRRVIAVTLMALLGCLALAACADTDKRAGNDRFGGWYGGTIGGASR